MAQRTYNDQGIQRALAALVPARTETYTPIDHRFFISNLDSVLRAAGLEIAQKRVYTNLAGTKLVGFTHVGAGNDFGLQMMIGYKNSYDKSMSAALVAGASVMICSNGIIGGDMLTFRRKHTGSIQEELNEKSRIAIERMVAGFTRLTLEASLMRDYTLGMNQKAEILGIMYFEADLISPNQLSIIKKEMHESEHFRGDSLWDLYNNVTESLKRSHPSRQIEDHIAVHDFMRSIAGIDPMEEEEEDVPQTPEPVEAETEPQTDADIHEF